MRIKLPLQSFSGGLWSERMNGRSDIPQYQNAVSQMENFFPLIEGPAQFREGLFHIFQEPTGVFGAGGPPGKIIGAKFSDGTSWIIWLKAYTIIFCKQDLTVPPYFTQKGRINYSLTDPVLSLLGWSGNTMREIDWQQIGDDIRLVHPTGGLYTIRYVGGSSFFKFMPTVFPDNAPWAIGRTYGTTSITISTDAQQGSEDNGGGKFFKLYAATALVNNIVGGTLIVNNASGGQSLIRWPLRQSGDNLANVGIKAVLVEPIKNWDGSTTTNWYYEGGGVVELDPSDTGPVGSLIDIDTGAVPKVAFELLANAVSNWTVSTADANVYYYNDTSGNVPPTVPDEVYVDGEPYDEQSGASLPSLAEKEWWFGDDAADSVGFNTIYIRVPSSVDPDTYVDSVASQVRVFYVMNDWSYNKSTIKNIGAIGDRIAINGGVVQIEGKQSNTQLECKVLRELDHHNATYDWQIYDDAFDSNRGYPSAIAYHEGRLAYGRKEEIFLSDAGNPDSFSIGTLDADSISYRLRTTERQQIRWLLSRDLLLVGTDVAEWIVGSREGAISPTNIFARQNTKYGTIFTAPLATVGMHNALFVDKAGIRIRELSYEFEQAAYRARNLNQFYSDPDAQFIYAVAFVPDPIPILYVIDADNQLYGMVYAPEDDVVAWFRVKTGTDANGAYDGTDLFGAVGVVRVDVPAVYVTTTSYVVVEVQRDLGYGSLEVFEPIADPPASNPGFYHLDSAAFGTKFSVAGSGPYTLSGPLDHLKNTVVTYIANGDLTKTGTATVNGSGEVVIPTAHYVANQMLVGLPYSGILKTMRPDAATGERGGIGQGVIKRVVKLYLRLINSWKGKVGPTTTAADLEEIDSTNAIINGDKEANFKKGHETDGRAIITQDRPLPFLVTMIQKEVEANDK